MSFDNLYRHDFVRVAVAVPEVRVADPRFNGEATAELIARADARRAALVVFPELGLSAYTCEDLFHQRALLDGTLEALDRVRASTRDRMTVAVVGLPLVIDGLLYNCAAVLHRGRVLGIVPKTYLPNYREFYELRQFTPGHVAVRESIELPGQGAIPFGSRLVFRAEDQPLFSFHVEICEDLWTPIPPSSYGALAGATVLVNCSASNVTVGKDDYRRQLVANQSGRCLAAYVYSASGPGESTTDLAWDAHGMVYENGSPLAETERFKYGAQLVTADVDLDRIAADRMRHGSFGQTIAAHRAEIGKFRTVTFIADLPREGGLALERRYERFPYVPADPVTRDARCREICDIQVQGLVTRLKAMGSDKMVIGVSGGLDSTQALIVCARAMDALGLPREHILAYTMPGFATSQRTRDQAWRLMNALRVTAAEIDIRPACLQVLKDIGHPFAKGEPVHDVTFENVQAGERTSLLFRLANRHNAPVVGTGDLSELALGWCTYGVGDQMSHYAVNASVPKTLIQFLVRFEARAGQLGAEAGKVLMDVLDTEISPELVPGQDNGQPSQTTESFVGPYELQDFHLYYTLRYGYRPSKVAYLAWNAWRDTKGGSWPDTPLDRRNEYTLGAIKKWLGVFLHRFFQTSQYKRSAIPNAPKVGSGGSLSPRGDWRAPSDAGSAVWIAELDRIPD